MATVTQSASVPAKAPPWSDSVTLDQIDPAQIIQTLTLSLTGNVITTATVANLEGQSSAFASTGTAALTLDRPDGSTWLTTAPSATIGATLPAGGPSSGWLLGATSLSATGSSSASASYGPTQSDDSDAAPLIGTGQATFPVTATNDRVYATGPGNMQARFTTAAGANVAVTAEVEHPITPGTPNQSGASTAFISYGSNIILTVGSSTANTARSLFRSRTQLPAAGARSPSSRLTQASAR